MPDASLNIGNTRRLRWTDAGALAHRRGQHGGLSYFRAMARGEIPRLPMYSVLDMRLIDVERGYCRFECEPGPHMLNPAGGVHGGIYAIFLDSAAGIAAQSWTDEGFATRTVRLNVDFFRPLTADSDTVFCEGRTVKTGRQIIVSDAAITDREGREYGRAQGTFMIVPVDGSAPPDGEAPPSVERDLVIEWGDPGATARASADRTGFEAMSMIADGRLPEPPVGRTLGFDLQSVGDGEAVFACEPTERLYNPMGSIHGGMPATLIDAATGGAVLTQLPAGFTFSTVSLTCQYFRAITVDTGPVTCTGRLVKHGRRVSVADASVTDRDGTVYARGTATCLPHRFPERIAGNIDGSTG